MTSLPGRVRWPLLGLAALVLMALAFLAANSLRPVVQTVSTTDKPCMPRPCAAPNGFEVHIQNVSITGGMVTMDVRFKNSTKPDPFEAVSYRHTSPADFQLRSADGSHVSPVFNNQCPDWGELDINRGTSAGPEPLCFPGPSSGLKDAQIIWSPDLGFLFNSVTIPLS